VRGGAELPGGLGEAKGGKAVHVGSIAPGYDTNVARGR